MLSWMWGIESRSSLNSSVSRVALDLKLHLWKVTYLCMFVCYIKPAWCPTACEAFTLILTVNLIKGRVSCHFNHLRNRRNWESVSPLLGGPRKSDCVQHCSSQRCVCSRSLGSTRGLWQSGRAHFLSQRETLQYSPGNKTPGIIFADFCGVVFGQHPGTGNHGFSWVCTGWE